nr:GYD domain-containing protein [Rubrobacteraceae bacterium]
MPLYMTQFAYTPEAWAALTRSPEDRSEPLRGLLENMGGRLVSFYNSFGEYDGLVIFEAPDE